jgi:asparagine synthase (glutamine-hydrolysing)
MFAFALFDRQERVFFAARDRVGKKPFYYRVDQDGIVFASEPRAFFAEPSFVATPNVQAIQQFVGLQYVPGEISAFAGVARLPPGHAMLVRDGQVEVSRYWQLSYEPKLDLSEAQAMESLAALLEESVRIRLIGDVPLGAFLSGGLDSSAVVALMAQASSTRVTTFSVGFDYKEHDELLYARQIATQFDTDHHEVIVRPDAAQIFDQLVLSYGEPYADGSAVPTYYLSEFARRHVTVALNGDGGDESFAGYRRYLDVCDEPTWMPAALRRALLAAGDSAVEWFEPKSTLARVAERARWLGASPGLRYVGRAQIAGPAMRHRLLSRDLARHGDGLDPQDWLLRVHAATRASDPLDRILALDVETYLPDCLLVKVDIASMSQGLEARSPLLDHRLMEFVARLPATWKLNGQDKKHIFKKVLRTFLPSAIIDRPKKGFSVPMDAWLRGELRPLLMELLSNPRHRARGYFEQKTVDGMVSDHLSRRRSWRQQLWALMMLEMWHRKFIDERPPVAAAA